MKILQIRKHGELKDSLSINEIENHRHRLHIIIETKAAGLNRSDYKNKILLSFFRKTEQSEILGFQEDLHDYFVGWQ
jgi:NADPH:quinone reductase-like Zn-dependent oxidoreductase